MNVNSLEEEREVIEEALSKRLEAHDRSRKAAQKRLKEICEGLETCVSELEDRVSSELCEKSTAESNRLQSALTDLRMDGGTPEAIRRAKAELLVAQSYDMAKRSTKEMDRLGIGVSSLYELKTDKSIAPEIVEMLRPTDVHITKISEDAISLQFICLSPEELNALSECEDCQIKYRCLLTKKGESKGREYDLKEKSDENFTFTPNNLEAGTAYEVRVKVVLGGCESEWSDEKELTEEGAGVDTPRPSTSGQDSKEYEKIEKMLSEHIEAHDESRNTAQDKLHEICEEMRTQISELKRGVNKELEKKFTAEDRHLQTLLSETRSASDSNVQKILQRARIELLVAQSYEVAECNINKEYDE